MDDTKKMLRTIINGQSSMKAELITKIDNLDKKLSTRIDSLETKMNQGFAEVNKRVDKIGYQLAKLEDDTPTIEEFDKLEKEFQKRNKNEP